MTDLPTRIRLGLVAQELAQAKASKDRITQQHLDDTITELLLIAEIGSETDPS